MTLMAQLAAELAQKVGPTGTPVGPYAGGAGGLWGVAGLERDVISTQIMPMGLAGRIPARGTNVINPMFPYLVGFDDDSGSDPVNVCDDGKTAGALETCLQTAMFGRYTRNTREFEVNAVGKQQNRGYFQDMRLVNPPLTGNGLLGNNGIVIPASANAATADFFNEGQMRMVEVGQSFQRLLGRQIWEANPVNSNAAGGYREFPGLDILIATDHRDAITQTPCPSLDSDIKDFNYKAVDDLTASGDIVNALTYMARYLKHNAEASNMSPTTWAVVMREELFYEITAVWPCSYLTRGCAFRNVDGTQVLNVDAGDQIAMRDAMRNGRYLLIDGVQYEVVFDSGIREETKATNPTKLTVAGTFASDIYFIPMTARGIALTFWEYFDFSGPNAAMDAIRELGFDNWYWTDGGRYLWARQPILNWCLKLIAKVEPRVILRTPHLAGRLLNVKYQPLQHTRDAYNDDPYFVGTGVGARAAAPSLYGGSYGYVL